MVTLSESVQMHTPLAVFDVHAPTYSHGLEAIYAIETIDIKSIRKLSIATPKIQRSTPFFTEYEESQLAFDLGPFFRGWSQPYTGKEPIQLLELNKHVEKILLEKQILTISDLLSIDFYGADFLKKLGQGHVEDIKNTLQIYLAEKPKERTTSIDFLSLVKCLFGDLDRRKSFIFLEPFGLGEWINLTPMEKKDIQRVSQETKQIWKEEVTALVFEGHRRKFFEEQFQLLVDTWLKPWMWARGGIANAHELDEAFSLRSGNENIAAKVIAFYHTYFSYENFLPHFETILTVNESLVERCKKICLCALSYFTQLGSVYSLKQLSAFMHAEFACQWENIWPEEIQQTLKLSSRYQVFRDVKGEWNVKPRINMSWNKE